MITLFISCCMFECCVNMLWVVQIPGCSHDDQQNTVSNTIFEVSNRQIRNVWFIVVTEDVDRMYTFANHG